VIPATGAPSGGIVRPAASGTSEDTGDLGARWADSPSIRTSSPKVTVLAGPSPWSWPTLTPTLLGISRAYLGPDTRQKCHIRS
jgi:hypothetical protein